MQTWYPYPGDELYRIPRFDTTINLTNLCLSWANKAAGYQFHYSVYWKDTEALAFTSPVGEQSDTGTGSATIGFSANQFLTIHAGTAGGTVDVPPTVNVWLVEGAVG
jgi:hypothetical protein